MRGNLGRSRRAFGGIRSIPAYAGEPLTALPRTMGTAVYPRVCGGTTSTDNQRLVANGLSPRMRGNQPLCRPRQTASGSIPAYAGEPRRTALPWWPPPVYPRVCGGTRPTRSPGKASAGLSPRMRGNPDASKSRCSATRSIPAYAGEPHTSGGRCLRIWVYPRVCGGTVGYRMAVKASSGLSPRMRGNLGGSARGIL